MNLGESLTLRSSEEQKAFGRRLASALAPGTLLFLEGELGAGKTTLVQGLLEGLAFTGEVSSPTYALMHEYPTQEGLVLHVDAYRVRDKRELFEMNLEDLLERSRLAVIEWGEAFYADFPEGWIVRLEHLTGGRRLTRVR